MSTPSLPIIDIAALAGSDPAARRSVAMRIDRACREQGFFYVVGHGVEAQLVERLERLARQFFALDETSKLRWRMELGGRAWRGYFPLGGELTSNRPDWKEGLYLGSELDAEHPEVRAGTPLHGANLFPEVPGLRETLLEYLDATTRVGHRLMEGIALGLGLEADYFAARYTGDPLILFRLFNYPSQPVPEGLDVQWGVGEHTDYGLLTLLHRPSRLQLALLLEAKDSGCVADALGGIRAVLGADGMRRVFRAVLTDNGAEFSDEAAIAALLGEGPGETRLFYCDPRRSDQKGACERNHVEIRKLLPKGAGLRFDRLAPADLALAMSHVNSEPRGALGFSTPARAFRAMLGDDAAALLDAYGVEDVALGDLDLTPGLIEGARAERGDAPLS